jgi:glycosyltransferase involved in cell wall biosynthesis
MDFPNAIDLEYFHRATEIERQRARAELDIPVERTLLVHFGWDWETKGGDLLLEAVVGLQRKGIEVIVMCVGGGHPARITGERLNLGRQLLVVPPRDDVRTFYAAADAFVACSRAEGMPFAVLEALSTGTPVVASTIPSHVLVAKQANGCVLSERSPHALAEAIRSVLSANANGDMAVDTGSLTDSLDLSAWARHLLELYTEIIRA